MKMIRYIKRIFRTIPKNAEEIRKRGGRVGNNFFNYGIIDNNHINLLSIGDNVFIGANSLILPNVAIGDNCIIGAGSVVVRDIPSGSVAVGNPCTVVGTYENFIAKNKELFNCSIVYKK